VVAPETVIATEEFLNLERTEGWYSNQSIITFLFGVVCVNFELTFVVKEINLALQRGETCHHVNVARNWTAICTYTALFT